MTPKRTRRRYPAECKAEVALAALTERQPLAEWAAHYQLATAQITRWKLQLRQQAVTVFAETPVPGVAVADIRVLRNGRQAKKPVMLSMLVLTHIFLAAATKLLNGPVRPP